MSNTKMIPLCGNSTIVHSDVWRIQSLRQKQSTPHINCTNNTRETNKRKHIVVSLLIVVATILLAACPEPTKDKASTAPPTASELLFATLAKAVNLPATTPEAKEKKQKNIQKILKELTKAAPKYKHKPKTKDDLAIFIKAEVWRQGTGGAQKWDADLNNIDTSQVIDMASLFSASNGLDKWTGAVPSWTMPTNRNDIITHKNVISRINNILLKTKPTEKQEDMKTLLRFIDTPTYKHKPKDKAELIVFIKAEVWRQGTGGAKEWEADLSNIDTSLITDMQYLFAKGKNGYGFELFNGSIADWNVSSVTTMYCMFAGATAFNQPLNRWDVSSVTTMYGMFAGAIAFNQPLNKWRVGKVTGMFIMFGGAKAFNQDLNDWDKHLKDAGGKYRKIVVRHMFRKSGREKNPPAWLAKIP